MTSFNLPVIFVIFQTHNRANGGVESITQIIEHMQRIKPIIVTQVETKTNIRWQNLGAEVCILPISYEMGSSFYQGSILQKLNRILDWVRTNYRMWRLVRTTKTPVVHCNDGLALWHTAFGARIAGASIVHNIRDSKPPDQHYGWHWHIIWRLSQNTIVLSQEMKSAFIQRFTYLERDTRVTKTSIDYIYSIVDFEQYHPPASLLEREQIRTQKNIKNKEVAIGYIAAFNPKKAQLAFIQQVLPALKDTSNIRFYFIGDFSPETNPYAHSCQVITKQLGLEHIVRFEGYSATMPDWYRALDFVVLASRYEGLARCMIESMASGIPVISFDVCSAHEILTQHTAGVVIPQANYQRLALEISKLITDQQRRAELGLNGHRAAQNLFASHLLVQQYEDLYGKLTENHPVYSDVK